MDLTAFIRDVPDFPRPGILFRDITPLLSSPDAFVHTLDLLQEQIDPRATEAIAAVESRGFLFASALADRLRLPLVPIRKPGKLPAARMSIEYTLEYGNSQLDIHEDALNRGDRVVLIDDLLATGGTAAAAAKLVELAGGLVSRILFVIELDDLDGRAQLSGYNVHSLIHY